MSLFWQHFKTFSLSLLRQPSYVVTTLMFPSLFFAFFGLPNIHSEADAVLLTGSFAGFGVIGVCLFQLAVYTANERSSSWSSYVKTLPCSPIIMLLARLSSIFILAFVCILIVMLTSFTFSPLSLSFQHWPTWILSLLLGTIPFSALGLTIGLLCNSKNVTPIANLLYLPLSFVGGLWVPPQGLSKGVEKVSQYLPTRHYGELIWRSSLELEFEWKYVGYLLIFSLLALTAATISMIRDNGQRYK
jgi:ABC-2 type transport system permease protein